MSDIVIDVQGLATRFGSHVVHEDLDLAVQQGEILGIVGGSGCGKTTLLREIIMLLQPSAGVIKVFGEDIHALSKQAQHEFCKRWGVMYQTGALISSLTVLENISFPLKEFTKLSADVVRDIAMLKLSMARFPLDSAEKMPSELSGGMVKRAALARAIVMDPDLLFLDEPTAGLDPKSAEALDELVLNLQASLGLTVVLVTHDLDTLWRVTDRVAFIGEKKILAVQNMVELCRNSHPLLQEYFSGPRAAAAQEREQSN